ncbi:hypothetical protein BGY98DRAFT_958674 [Russula aff. rugulosa BPL654]|nr:hypothetical protein BGY98DRAFT_958674 [Russula aff. rugulosa BPL654]
MCYNIIDGRFHQTCCHFKAMSTRRQDCMRHICFFSYRHSAQCTSRTCRCKRTMDAPILNPIRLSPTRCPDCVQVERLKPDLTESEPEPEPES